MSWKVYFVYSLHRKNYRTIITKRGPRGHWCGGNTLWPEHEKNLTGRMYKLETQKKERHYPSSLEVFIKTSRRETCECLSVEDRENTHTSRFTDRNLFSTHNQYTQGRSSTEVNNHHLEHLESQKRDSTVDYCTLCPRRGHGTASGTHDSTRELLLTLSL